MATWHEKRGIGHEADPRHVEIINQQLPLQEAKSVSTLGTTEEGRTVEGNEEPLNEDQATKYRILVARCNYSSPDRPDIAFAVKDLARHMSTPRKGDWIILKRLGRYLVGKPRFQQWFTWQGPPTGFNSYTDADWAGRREIRKSTTGGVVMLGSHGLKSWSKTQALISLSSGEFELYATLKASADTFGIMAMLDDYGVKVKGKIWGDAQAALGIIHRKGLGKTRHIQTGFLWVQQISVEKRLTFGEVLGKVNPADLFTKYLDQSNIEQHVARMNCTFEDGRASEAPKLHNFSTSMEEYEALRKWKRWEWLGVIYNHDQLSSEEDDQRRTRRLCQGELNVCGRAIGNEKTRKQEHVENENTVGGNSSQNDLGQPVLQGGQAAGAGIQRVESRPASPSLGFDPNPSIKA